MSFSFERHKRLLSAGQFKAVFDSTDGKVSGRNVLILARENQLEHPRLGLVIGKKSVKLAVQRNRIKRQIRQSFRLNQAQLSGWDIVVIARKGLADASNDQLSEQFAKIWKRLLRQAKHVEGE